MKKLYFLIALAIAGSNIYCQNDYILDTSSFVVKSKKIVDEKPAFSLVFKGNVKTVLTYDFVGVPNNTALNIPSIPVGEVEKDPYFDINVLQSRLGFTAFHQTALGTVMAKVETDFYGFGDRGNLRLRQAYVAFRNWEIGHTFSTFCDLNAWPVMLDWDGPPTGVWVRQGMIRYTWHINQKNSVSGSVETPVAEVTYGYNVDTLLNIANQNVPDILFKYNFSNQRLNVQFSTVYRSIRYKVIETGDFNFVPGYGFLVSGQVITYGLDRFYFQLSGGKGIARYYVGYGGLNWDGAAIGKDKLELLPITGGFIAYDHYWGRKKKLSSTAVLGSTTISNNVFTDYGNFLEGYWGMINLLFYPVHNLQFGIEYTQASRVNAIDESGWANRIQFMAFYQF